MSKATILYLFLNMYEEVIKQSKAINVSYSHLAGNSVSSLKYRPCELYVAFFKMVLFCSHFLHLSIDRYKERHFLLLYSSKKKGKKISDRPSEK